MSLLKSAKFILAIGLQLVIIFSIILFHLAVLKGGVEVNLRIEPVDPRDYLRGDYVTFRYDISTVNDFDLVGSSFNNGDTVYVKLRNSGDYAQVEEVLKAKPANSDDIFIRGKITSGAQANENSLDSMRFDRFNSDIQIEYGIEQYFIPEGTGQNLDLINSEAYAKVSVGENGDAVLKKIYINNKPWPN